jgi:acetolactate synthase-1/2/3 large subunit
MRCADFLANYFYSLGVDTVFMVTGGGAMHLNDAFARHGGFEIVFCHHEQSCAMAADAYFRVSKKPAIVQVTTGPGAINALNGVFGAFVDSVPMIVISGQVRSDNISSFASPGLRQMGDQEAPVTHMVKHITKYSKIVFAAEELEEIAKTAWIKALTGRPGPTWIDIPINVQGSQIEPKTPTELKRNLNHDALSEVSTSTVIKDAVDTIIDAIQAAERPILIAGNGIQFSQTVDELRRIGKHLKVPITTVWNAHDIIPNSHPSFCGRTGSDGDRAGNFAVQNADLILILGARMAIRQVGFNHTAFGRAAKQIMVDLDPIEMNKPTLRIDNKFEIDLRRFMPEFLKLALEMKPLKTHANFLDWCQAKVIKYPTVLPHHYETQAGPINPYVFVKDLFDALPNNCTVVTGDGTAAVVTFKAANIKADQRLFTNKGCASMGFDLPAAIGAFYANKDRPIICIAGDGSIMMNVQELQTIVGNEVPVKIFVLNNNGYHSIRQSQTNYFEGFEVGCGPQSGVTFPSFEKLAGGFGIDYTRINNKYECATVIQKTLASDNAVMCEVMLNMEQLFEPRLSSRKLPDGNLISSPLEDMAPFLDREEFENEMIVAPLESK